MRVTRWETLHSTTLFETMVQLSRRVNESCHYLTNIESLILELELVLLMLTHGGKARQHNGRGQTPLELLGNRKNAPIKFGKGSFDATALIGDALDFCSSLAPFLLVSF
jgi:hypothetical protein